MIDLSHAWLGEGFAASAQEMADRPALSFDDREVSYGELAQRMSAIRKCLEPVEMSDKLTAVLGTGTIGTFAGILGALFAGHGYVPLNPKFPTDRLNYMLDHSGCRAVVVDAQREEVLSSVISGRTGLTLVFADRDDVSEQAKKYPDHIVLAGKTNAPADLSKPPVDPQAPAYILYTSGSTGAPKGVAVTHANVRQFLEVMNDKYAFKSTDRFSHMFDLSFDLSVFDLFMSWRVGACMCVPNAQDQKLPSDYILREAISVWFSVPSVVILMQRLRQLEPGRFPSIRMSLFCGEAMPEDAGVAWADTAPNSSLHNIYGPTEVTLACTWYDMPRTSPDPFAENGIIPIGKPYEEMAALIVDGFEEVPPGALGELLMSGPQVAQGYWRDADKTDAAFVTHPDTKERFYRTGDLVRAPLEPGDPITYMGRVDHQIKLHGHRVELGEIEEVLKDVSKAHRTVVVAWPIRDGAAQGLAAFLECENLNTAEILDAAKKRLPDYMIPKKLMAVSEFPLNANGKIDRRALSELL